MTSLVHIVTVAAMAHAAFAQPSAQPVTAAPSRDVPRVESILSQMTLAEKIGQLNMRPALPPGTSGGGAAGPEDGKRADEIAAREGKVGSFLTRGGAEITNRLQHAALESRLRVPVLFGADVIHGYRTITPTPLAESCSWNLELIADVARASSREARAAGIHWTFAPMVDIARDARWGRIIEGAGEDPWLGSAIAVARVRGFQGADLTAADSLLATAKHFAAYGAAEGGRDYNTAEMSRLTLHAVYLPPFEAAARAGVGSFMNAFNDVDGVPSTVNEYLLRTTLRGMWKWDGLVVSDYNSINETIAHGVSRDQADAASRSLRAGVDTDMAAYAYVNQLEKLVAAGEISESLIDESARRVLQAKDRLGLFDSPFIDAASELPARLTPAHRAMARTIAQQSIVLLKPDASVLPIPASAKRIAVIGPLADNAAALLGNWCGEGQPQDVITIKAALERRVGDGRTFIFEPGCHATGDETESQLAATLDRAATLASSADLVLLVIGETADLSGEAHSRSTLALPGNQQRLAERVIASGTPTVAVLVTGRPLATPWLHTHAKAVLNTWHLGVEHGNATADVLLGDVSPSGRLTVTVPRDVGQIPIYYNHRPTGRPPSAERYSSKYIDLDSTPLYAFGSGFTYSTFGYSDVKMVPAPSVRSVTEASRQVATVSCVVTNTGAREATEVPQLYIRAMAGPVSRPVRELAGFERLTLKPGESRTVTFTITTDTLAYPDETGVRHTHAGKYLAWISPDAASGTPVEMVVY